MKRSIIMAAAVACASIGLWGSSATAQSVGLQIYAGPSPDRSYRYDYRDGPRVYGYSRTYDEPSVNYEFSASDDDANYPRRAGGCGTYRFWDGSQCVDARYRRNPN